MTEYSSSEFQKLMASVGYLMFHWSLLEGELADDIRRLQTKAEGPATPTRVRGSFSEQLKAWRGLLNRKVRPKSGMTEAVAELANEIERLRCKRNLVAHGFAGASARPENEEPFITCAPMDRNSPRSQPTRITLSELTRMIEAIERCRTRIRRVAAGYGASA